MTRKATVMEGGVASPKGAAELRFRGQWLRSIGFHPGMRVVVSSPAAGVLELRIDSVAQLAAEDFKAVIAGFEKAGVK